MNDRGYWLAWPPSGFACRHEWQPGTYEERGAATTILIHRRTVYCIHCAATWVYVTGRDLIRYGVVTA